MDLGYDLAAFAQEVACRRVEEAARRAREAASLTLLRELEAEEAARAGGEGKVEVRGEAAAGTAGAKGAKKNKAKGKVDKAREKKEKEELERAVSDWAGGGSVWDVYQGEQGEGRAQGRGAVSQAGAASVVGWRVLRQGLVVLGRAA